MDDVYLVDGDGGWFADFVYCAGCLDDGDNHQDDDSTDDAIQTNGR